jgi:hypothetical protein
MPQGQKSAAVVKVSGAPQELVNLMRPATFD